MIKVFLQDVPRMPHLAVSGGVDSMAALSFLTRGKHRIAGVVTINHNTTFGSATEDFVLSYCRAHNIICHTHAIHGSTEEEWRAERQRVFAQYPAVVTAHHLDDVVEWWMLTSMRGNGRLIPFKTKNVYHPFLKTRKSAFEEWCRKHNVPFLTDPTNIGDHNDRAKLRVLMPALLAIYPGIHSSILKKL